MSVWTLYRIRLRRRWMQELLAVAGIAIGVALIYASQVANTSIGGPVRQLNQQLVGTSQLQLVGRGPDGFPGALAATVRTLPGVRGAVPVLQAQGTLVGPRGQRAVGIVGVDPRSVRHRDRLMRALMQGMSASDAAAQRALTVPAPIARAIGARFGDTARLQIGGRDRAVPVAVIDGADAGALLRAAIIPTALAYAQSLAHLDGRVTRILVEAAPAQVDAVRERLRRLAGPRHLDVRDADYEPRLFAAAAKPTRQSNTIGSVISGLVGFLFAFCSLLVTAGGRRTFAADLRLDGYTPGAIARVLLLDALMLATVAVGCGLALGEVVSRRGFGGDIGFLSAAFPVGDQRVVTWTSVAIAAGAGLVAAVVGVLAPLRGTQSARSVRETRKAAGTRRGRPVIAAPLAGVTALGVAIAISVGARAAGIIGLVALGAAVVLLLPTLVVGVTALLAAASRRSRQAIPAIELAVPHLRAREGRTRALAIAATGAVAVLGSVAIQGARTNLQAGLDRMVGSLSDEADVWVGPVGAGDLFGTLPFAPRDDARLRSVVGVRGVSRYRATLMDIDDQRAWVIAPPAGAPHPIPAAEVLRGDARQATARLRAGGWATVSGRIADDLGLNVGDRFMLPSSVPRAMRVAAITTNIGWPAGAIIVNADDYLRAWRSAAIGAYEVRLAAGMSAEEGVDRIRRALGPRSVLRVETGDARSARQRVASRGGLTRLSQIAALTLAAAVLAMTAAMAGLLWQRQTTVARQKLDGYGTAVLWRSLIIESAALFVTGCGAGALFGLVGQLLMSGWVQAVGGFPAVVVIRGDIALSSFALVAGAALAVVTVPGLLVARVAPSLRTGE